MQAQPRYQPPEESALEAIVPEEPVLKENSLEASSKPYTPEEYLSLEEVAEFRSEYRDGKITPMTGGSADHNSVVVSSCIFPQVFLERKEL